MNLPKEGWEAQLFGCFAGLVVIVVVFAFLYWLVKKID